MRNRRKRRWKQSLSIFVNGGMRKNKVAEMSFGFLLWNRKINGQVLRRIILSLSVQTEVRGSLVGGVVN